jgi:acyl-CoA thioester hydrolase
MHSLPSFEDVAPLTWGPRFDIGSDMADENGHLNVRHYLTLYDEAVWEVLGLAGIGKDYSAAGVGGVFTLEQHLRYHREVHIGDTVAAAVRVLARTGRMVHLMSYLVNRTRAEVAGSLESLEVHMDLHSRRLSPFPPDAAGRLDELAAAGEYLTWTPALSNAIHPH